MRAYLEGAAFEHEHAASLGLLREADSLQLLFQGFDLRSLGVVVPLQALKLAGHPGI